MQTESLITVFETLGLFLKQFSTISFTPNPDLKDINLKFSDNFQKAIKEAELKNPWFSEESLHLSFSALSSMLEKGKLQKWMSNYPEVVKPSNKKNIGLVSAGNIPLVAFHDILSVLITGHNLHIKLSSKDDTLFPEIRKILIYLSKDFEKRIFIYEGKLENIEAVIATGSNNSSRYFEYYFGKYPHIIRSNRNSVAILTGKESPEQLRKLADDVFLYFGLGCRNVSKIYIPKGYDPTIILDNLEQYSYLKNHTKYANNYDYQRAILLVNTLDFLDNNFLVFRENTSLNSPVACLHYEFYDTIDSLKTQIELEKDKIQCLVSEKGLFDNVVDFGQTQYPDLNDFADNIDTIEFLLNLYEK